MDLGVGRMDFGNQQAMMTTATPPLVSVIVPMYNRADTIRRSLISVLTQELTALEVIVVDDGSTDLSVELVEKIGDPRVRILRSMGREGAPAARNHGIAAATGEWVAFQDSDDLWLPDKLSKQFAALADMSDADACYCRLLQLYGGRARVIPELPSGPQGAILPDLIGGSFISTQTLMVRSAVLHSLDAPFDPLLPRFQDWDLVLRLAKAGVRFACADEPLAIAFDTPGNLSSFAMKAVDARDRIFAKHPEMEREHPRAFARQYFIMASLSLHNGQRDRAAAAIARACSLDPLNIKYRLFATIVTARRLTS